MYADSKESAYGSTFLVSPPNSIYGRVYTKNMDETSFIGYDFENGLQRVLDILKLLTLGIVLLFIDNINIKLIKLSHFLKYETD